MNHCPVYQNVGGHSYGWVYPGPIGSILTPMYVGLEKAQDLPAASTMCNQCGVVCPVKIPLPDLQRKLREQRVRARAAARGTSALALARVGVGRAASRALRARARGSRVRVLKTMGGRERLIHRLPFGGRLDRRPRHAGAGGANVPRALSAKATGTHRMNAPHDTALDARRSSRGAPNRSAPRTPSSCWRKSTRWSGRARTSSRSASASPTFPTPTNIQDAGDRRDQERQARLHAVGRDRRAARGGGEGPRRRGAASSSCPRTSSSARARSRSSPTRSRRSPITAPATR